MIILTIIASPKRSEPETGSNGPVPKKLFQLGHGTRHQKPISNGSAIPLIASNPLIPLGMPAIGLEIHTRSAGPKSGVADVPGVCALFKSGTRNATPTVSNRKFRFVVLFFPIEIFVWRWNSVWRNGCFNGRVYIVDAAVQEFGRGGLNPDNDPLNSIATIINVFDIAPPGPALPRKAIKKLALFS